MKFRLSILLGVLQVLAFYIVFPVIRLNVNKITYFRIDEIISWLIISIFYLKVVTHRVEVKEIGAKTVLFFFLGYAFISTFIVCINNGFLSLPHLNSLWHFLKFSEGVLLFAAVQSIFRGGDFEKIWKCNIFLLLLVSVCGIFQFWEILPRYTYTLSAGFKPTYPRDLTATLSFNKGHLGAVLVFNIFYFFERVLKGENILLRLLNSFTVVLLCYVLFETHSRSSWVGFVIGLGAYVVFVYSFYSRSEKKHLLYLMFFLIGLFLFSVVRVSYIRDVLLFNISSESYKYSSFEVRLHSYSNFLRSWIEDFNVFKILLGTGLGYWTYSALAEYTSMHSGHNVFLQYLGELGLIGFGIFVYFLLYYLKKVLSLREDGGNNVTFPKYFFVAGYIGLIGTSFGQDTFYPVWALESLFNYVMFFLGIYLREIYAKGTVG